jgi:HEPN domain-containing protein
VQLVGKSGDAKALSIALAEQFRVAAERELQSARDLQAVGKDWSSVYWHAGYAVELMLKAIRIKSSSLTEWPPADKGARWHDLEYVVERSGLKAKLKHERRSSSKFAAYWLATKDWDHSRRYPPDSPTKIEAKDLLLAVMNPTSGVMPCLRQIYQSI